MITSLIYSWGSNNNSVKNEPGPIDKGLYYFRNYLGPMYFNRAEDLYLCRDKKSSDGVDLHTAGLHYGQVYGSNILLKDSEMGHAAAYEALEYIHSHQVLNEIYESEHYEVFLALAIAEAIRRFPKRKGDTSKYDKACESAAATAYKIFHGPEGFRKAVQAAGDGPLIRVFLFNTKGVTIYHARVPKPKGKEWLSCLIFPVPGQTHRDWSSIQPFLFKSKSEKLYCVDFFRIVYLNGSMRCPIFPIIAQDRSGSRGGHEGRRLHRAPSPSTSQNSIAPSTMAPPSIDTRGLENL